MFIITRPQFIDKTAKHIGQPNHNFCRKFERGRLWSRPKVWNIQDTSII